MKKITLEIKKPLAGKLPGSTIVLDCDRDGVIIDRYWRRRLQDSEIDDCVKILKNKSAGAKT